MQELPPLSSADLEALFRPPAEPSSTGPYQELEATAAWLLDPSPVASNDMIIGGVDAPDFSPTGVVDGVSADLVFGPADPLAAFLDSGVGGSTSFLPMPAGNGATLPATLLPAANGASSGRSGTNSGADFGVPASVITSMPTGHGGSKGGKKELTEEQKERIKAKNRRAQSRYREKQKAKAAATEAEYNQAARELERLRLENSRLQEQQVAMEQVLSVREDWMSKLERGKEAADEDAAHAAAAAAAGKACALPSVHTGGTAGTAATALAVCGESEGGADGNSPCSCPLTGLTLSQIAELKQTPPEAVQRRWRGIAQRLANSLQQLDSAQNSQDATVPVTAKQYEAEIEAVLREGQSFCFELAIHSPANVQKLFAAALDDGRSQISAKDMQHWEAVATSLRLSEQQLVRLEAAREVFIQRIAEVCAERRAIFERLQGLEGEVPTSLRAMQHATAAWLKVHEATAELTANMNLEHCVCMGFVRDAFGYVLTPLQKAATIVKSYPFFPDMYSVSTAALKASHPALLAPAGAGAAGLLAGGAPGPACAECPSSSGGSCEGMGCHSHSSGSGGAGATC